MGARLPAGYDDGIPVGDRRQTSQADVFRGGGLVGDVVLEHAADLTAQGCRVVVTKVDAVDQDAARSGVVQPADQLEECRLAGAVSSDDGDGLPGRDRETQLGQGILLGVGIGKADLLETDLSAQGAVDGDRFGRRRQTAFRFHQLEEIAQIEVVLVHSGEPAEDPLDRVLNRLGGRCVEGEVAERQSPGDRLDRDI